MRLISHINNDPKGDSCIMRRAPFFQELKMKKTLSFVIILAIFASCGDSVEERKRLSRAERARLAKEDSLALKVGVLPTLDCLPLYVARQANLFEKFGADVRLKPFNSQIDCDAALVKGSIEGCVTDVVRAERMKRQGRALRYATATNAYWQLISNRKARVREIRQLEDKMMAMTRFSATDLLGDLAVDSVKMRSENVFRVQINDPNVRLQMLLNNEMDAMLLTEPQATTARLLKNPVLMDSKQRDIRLGAVVIRENDLKDQHRSKQYQVFLKAYNSACDSINKYGVLHYSELVKKFTKADDRTLKALPKMHFQHASSPRQKDIDRAVKWLK